MSIYSVSIDFMSSSVTMTICFLHLVIYFFVHDFAREKYSHFVDSMCKRKRKKKRIKKNYTEIMCIDKSAKAPLDQYASDSK